MYNSFITTIAYEFESEGLSITCELTVDYYYLPAKIYGPIDDQYPAESELDIQLNYVKNVAMSAFGPIKLTESSKVDIRQHINDVIIPKHENTIFEIAREKADDEGQQALIEEFEANLY